MAAFTGHHLSYDITKSLSSDVTWHEHDNSNTATCRLGFEGVFSVFGDQLRLGIHTHLQKIFKVSARSTSTPLDSDRDLCTCDLQVGLSSRK